MYNFAMLWSSEELQKVLADLRQRGGDSALVEVKKAGEGVPQLTETLCSFGNMPDGGTIILGVDESEGFVVSGLKDIAAIESGVANQARSSVIPPVRTDFDQVTLDGKDVLVVTVAGLPSVDRPCRVRGKAYLRQSDGDYVMSEQEVAQVIAQQDRPRYDAVPVEGSSINDLDNSLVEDFLTEARSVSRRLAGRTDIEVLRLKGVMSADRLTVAGLYGLGSYPQQYAPSLAVTAAAAPRSEGQRVVDLSHMDGPVPDLLEQSIEWVRRNTRNAVVFDSSGHGSDAPEIPMVAIREFVANALIHRDLSAHTQSKRVEIRLYPDRLVVTSPGGLWGVSKDQLGEPGGKSAVNEFLYDIGRLVRTPSRNRVIEGEGGGIREAKDALRKAGLPEPRFIDTGVSFTVIIFRNMADTQMASTRDNREAQANMGRANESVVLDALAFGETSITELIRRSGLSRRQVKYALNDLISSGRVIMVGGQGNRLTTYRQIR